MGDRSADLSAPPGALAVTPAGAPDAAMGANLYVFHPAVVVGAGSLVLVHREWMRQGGDRATLYRRAGAFLAAAPSRCSRRWRTSSSRARASNTLPAFYVVGILTAYLSDDHQRVGDHAAKTVVVSTAG